MAEFCLNCFNKFISNKKLTKKDVIMDIDLCEGCGEWRPCVVRIKEKNILKWMMRNIARVFRKIVLSICKKSRYQAVLRQ